MIISIALTIIFTSLTKIITYGNFVLQVRINTVGFLFYSNRALLLKLVRNLRLEKTILKALYLQYTIVMLQNFLTTPEPAKIHSPPIAKLIFISN